MDKRLLEAVISDQKEELEQKKNIRYCRRKEEECIELDSPQAQVVIGKLTVCSWLQGKQDVEICFF